MTTPNDRSQGQFNSKEPSREKLDQRAPDIERRPGETSKDGLAGAPREPRERQHQDRERHIDRPVKHARPPQKSVEDLSRDLARADEEGMTAAPENP